MVLSESLSISGPQFLIALSGVNRVALEEFMHKVRGLSIEHRAEGQRLCTGPHVIRPCDGVKKWHASQDMGLQKPNAYPGELKGRGFRGSHRVSDALLLTLRPEACVSRPSVGKPHDRYHDLLYSGCQEKALSQRVPLSLAPLCTPDT